MFGVQLYKNNARALLSRILSILNLDWLQHARSVWIGFNSLKRAKEAHLWGSFLWAIHLTVFNPQIQKGDPRTPIPPCVNGVISYWAPIGVFGFLQTTHTRKQTQKMPPQSSHAMQRFSCVQCIFQGQTAVHMHLMNHCYFDRKKNPNIPKKMAHVVESPVYICALAPTMREGGVKLGSLRSSTFRWCWTSQRQVVDR